MLQVFQLVHFLIIGNAGVPQIAKESSYLILKKTGPSSRRHQER